MTLANELAYCSLTELTRKISQRELSPVEVINAFIDRVETRNPSLNAFVCQDFERAREEAQTAEKQLMAGDALGPLHGIPVAIKDLFSSKPGTPMTMGGVRALKDNITQHRCIFTERIEQAGAIVIGKTNSPVMGFRGTCDNYLFGPSRNPFCPDKNTGGSSGGAAATVADGMLPLAEGTDGGGSIRIPASWCGVYGYKAAYGRVPSLSRPNAFASDTPFSFSGPITRTVEDAALALNALAGYHPRDPYSIDDDTDFLPAVKRSIRGWKIAYSRDLDVFPVDPQVSRVIDTQVKAFEEEGAHVEEVKIGIGRPQQELSDLWCRLIIPRNITSLDAAKASGVEAIIPDRSLTAAPFPNPAGGPSPTIHFPVALQTAEEVSLSLFDTAGDLVDRIEPRYLPRGGEYLAAGLAPSWDVPAHLSDGIYLYVLTGTTIRRAGKVAVLRGR